MCLFSIWCHRHVSERFKQGIFTTLCFITTFFNNFLATEQMSIWDLAAKQFRSSFAMCLFKNAPNVFIKGKGLKCKQLSSAARLFFQGSYVFVIRGKWNWTLDRTTWHHCIFAPPYLCPPAALRSQHCHVIRNRGRRRKISEIPKIDVIWKMPGICCAVGCDSSQQRNPGMQFYSLPKDVDRRNKWLAAIRRDHWHDLSKPQTVEFTLKVAHTFPFIDGW